MRQHGPLTSRPNLLVVVAASVILAFTLLPTAHGQNGFISFDAPGAGTANGQGTIPTAINDSGLIGGFFIDGANGQHGFLRAPDGTFTTVDIPNAVWTQVHALNNGGAAVGDFLDHLNRWHGFLRNARGKYREIKNPGDPMAGLVAPQSVNDVGQVVGTTSHGQFAVHGFVWDLSGTFTAFDVPGAPAATYPASINAGGQITGYFYPPSGGARSFLRDAAGIFTTFDLGIGMQTFAADINTSGQITGSFLMLNGSRAGYVRDPDGTITQFSFPGLTGIAGDSINDTGVIVGGNFTDQGNVSIERDQSGNVSLIPVPFPNKSNWTIGINQTGQIVGVYVDSAGVNHGWTK